MNDRDRFDKFTERARHVLAYAQEEAQNLQHNYIGTEHLLLGLVREGDGIAARVLSQLGIEINRIRSSVEFIVGRGDRIVLGEIGLTPRAKKVIELATDEARRLDHHYIGTEHLLLGLVREGEGIAAGVLESLGANLANVRSTTIKILQANGEKIPPQFDEARPHPIKNRDRFDKFTERARRVLTYAHEEAQRFQHNYIGTEHLLLGLIREHDGVAAQVLAKLGIELDGVRQSVESIIGRGDRIVLGQIGLTPRAKKVIELAVDEARRMDHHYIGTEHLLLGLVREDEGIAANVLTSQGASLSNVRKATIEALGTNSEKVTSIDTDLQQTTSLLPFSTASRRVLTFAQGEALLFLHDFIDTEHILLGLIREPGLASDTLTSAGLTLERAHDATLQTIGQGDNTSTSPIRPDQAITTLLYSASKHATDLHHSSIEPYHILLALFDEQPEKPYLAQTILTSLDTDIPTLRFTLLQSIQNLPGSA